MRLVLFDCDGTLVDSAALIHEVMVRTFAAFDLAAPVIAETKAIIGLTLDIAIARLLGQPHVNDRALAMTAHYKSIFAGVRQEPGFEEALFPGIGPLVAALSRRPGLKIGAVTGKSRRGLQLIAGRHGFDTVFSISRTADDCPSKPHPAMVIECCEGLGIAPRDTVVVGDAVYDMQMAKAAGAAALGVAWGYAPVPALVEAGADHIARTPQDIHDWLELQHA
ncbi:HAD-IA family hydrolase [Ensifer soli]|uniref:HAD-IA family hydrolase n=1 Tax=Ciceribacter sp. sgz301302 TaxID=3342379 RepID=UPI0035B97F79